MKKILFLISVLSALWGCSDKKNCKNTACTALFAMIQVNLSDTSNPSLTGVNSETVLKPSGQTIHTQSGPNSTPQNDFTVVDDSDLQELGFNSNQEVEVRILKNGVIIKTIPFSIKTDCCHISKVSGPEEVSLN